MAAKLQAPVATRLLGLSSSPGPEPLDPGTGRMVSRAHTEMEAIRGHLCLQGFQPGKVAGSHRETPVREREVGAVGWLPSSCGCHTQAPTPMERLLAGPEWPASPGEAGAPVQALWGARRGMCRDACPGSCPLAARVCCSSQPGHLRRVPHCAAGWGSDTSRWSGPFQRSASPIFLKGGALGEQRLRPRMPKAPAVPAASHQALPLPGSSPGVLREAPPGAAALGHGVGAGQGGRPRT